MSAAADVSPTTAESIVVSPHQRPKQQALISLSDKRDVGFLAKGLVDLGYNRVFVSCVSLLFDVKLNAEVCLQSFPYCL
jgi:hypothetical protein